MRMRKKKNLQARMEHCAPCWAKEPQTQRGTWRALLPGARALYLELGCGKGRFTCELAAQNPDVLFLAIERVPDAMITAMERASAEHLSNVFFIDGDAARLSDYFAPNEVDRIYINFCDPWPGQQHAKRRLTSEGFLRRYREILTDNGALHFKTDNRALFAFSLFQFPKAGYAIQELTHDLHAAGICGVMTDYEEKFHKQGLPIHRCVAQKQALPPPIPKEAEKMEFSEN